MLALMIWGEFVLHYYLTIRSESMHRRSTGALFQSSAIEFPTNVSTSIFAPTRSGPRHELAWARNYGRSSGELIALERTATPRRRFPDATAQ